jgi:carbon-monoxide dehydrogenase large subunit
MTGHGVGAPVKRREDPRFLTGTSCFTDDVSLPGQVYAAVVRSPHAHAGIRRIDTTEAFLDTLSISRSTLVH